MEIDFHRSMLIKLSHSIKVIYIYINRSKFHPVLQTQHEEYNYKKYWTITLIARNGVTHYLVHNCSMQN